MSGSLTVIGGHTGGSMTGLVNIPMDQTTATLSGLGLQAELTSISGAVTSGAASFTNNDIAGGTVDSAIGTDSTSGVFEITNTDSTGAVTAGTISGGFVVPSDYSTLVVQAPGTETITGNGTTNFLAIFSSQSTVSFSATGNSNGASGTGTIVASGNNFIDVGGTYANGQGWSVIGGASGGDTINTTAEHTSITTQGAGNVIGLAGVFSTVVAGGTGDLISGIGGDNTISMTGAGGNFIDNGGADTIYASGAAETAFFANTGGLLDFINTSGAGATVAGSQGTGGSLTVFGGAGGYYQGGVGGNNSLVGGTGSGATTLIGAGNNNFLSVQGSGDNALFADVPNDTNGGGSATLVAGTGTDNNLFQAGTGTESLVSYGSGNQNFFVGTQGTETLVGSTVSGAINHYYFEQTSLQGGTDIIANFTVGTDHVMINPFSGGGVSVQSVANTTIDGTAGAQVQLTDNTIIKLLGVTFTNSEITSITGSTGF